MSKIKRPIPTDEELIINGLEALDDALSYFGQIKNKSINILYTDICNSLIDYAHAIISHREF